MQVSEHTLVCPILNTCIDYGGLEGMAFQLGQNGGLGGHESFDLLLILCWSCAGHMILVVWCLNASLLAQMTSLMRSGWSLMGQLTLFGLNQ